VTRVPHDPEVTATTRQGETSTPVSGSRHLAKGAVDGRTLGQAAHQVIGEMVRAGVFRPSPLELRAHVARHPLVSHPQLVYRQAGKQRVLTATAVYFRYFAPELEWSLEGLELTHGSSRFDLVWRTGSGFLIDEIKSTRIQDRFDRDKVEEQVARARANGLDLYGEGFVGVRLCMLSAPTRSYILSAAGVRTNLDWDHR
jgi:hypothetical protein